MLNSTCFVIHHERETRVIPYDIIHILINSIRDAETLVRFSAMNKRLYQLVTAIRQKKPCLVQNGTLVVTVKNGIPMGAIEMKKRPYVRPEFFDLTKYVKHLRFTHIRVRNIESDQLIEMLEHCRGYCKTLILEMESFHATSYIRKLVERLKPETTKLDVRRHIFFSAGFMESLDESTNVDIALPDIERLTNDIRYFIFPHQIAVFRVRMFSTDVIRRLLRRFDQNVYSFGHLKRLEIHLTDKAFVYCPFRLCRGRRCRSLGKSFVFGEAIVMGEERKALLIFETFRIVMIPLATEHEELVHLAEEFSRKVPVDLSALLDEPTPFTKMLELQQTKDVDDWWE